MKVVASAVATTAAQAAPQLSTPVFTSTPGTSMIRMAVTLPGEYLLERSEDLKTWEYLDSIECGQPETIEFCDSSSSLGVDPPKKRVFYRIGYKVTSQVN